MEGSAEPLSKLASRYTNTIVVDEEEVYAGVIKQTENRRVSDVCHFLGTSAQSLGQPALHTSRRSQSQRTGLHLCDEGWNYTDLRALRASRPRDEAPDADAGPQLLVMPDVA